MNLSSFVFKIISVICGVLFLSQDVYAEDFSKLWHCEDNEHYREKIKRGHFDFSKKSLVAENSIEFFAVEGGSHLGYLYILLQDEHRKPVIHRLALGPVVAVLTKNDLSRFSAISSLKDDEVLVLASTGGTGVHVVYGCVIKVNQKSVNIVSTFPLWGHCEILWGRDDIPDTQKYLQYTLKSYQREQNGIVLKFETAIDYDPVENKTLFDKIPYIQSLKDDFEITFDQDSKPKLKGSKSILEKLEWILSLDIEVKTLKPSQKSSQH